MKKKNPIAEVIVKTFIKILTRGKKQMKKQTRVDPRFEAFN